jgi:glycosyltransferase involved in cell wall biosynthesis
MGKAIVVEETAGTKEIIKDGYNGLLYKNAKDFEKKIILLVNNPDLRKSLEKQSKINIKEHRWGIREKEFKKIIGEIKK